MATLVDTGPLVYVALDDATYAAHYRSLLRSERAPVITSEACVAEAAYFVAQAAKWRGIRALVGLLAGIPVELRPVASRLSAVADLAERYGDLPMDYADATLVDLAHQLNTTRVMTTDLKDFRIYRGPRDRPFHIAGLDD